MSSKMTAAIAVLLAVIVLAPRSSLATEYTWTASPWSDLWFDDPANWSPAGYPDDASDIALFNTDFGSAVTVNFRQEETNRKIEVSKGDVWLYIIDYGSAHSVEYKYTLDPLFPASDTAAVIGTTAGPLTTLYVKGDVDAGAKLQIGRDVGSNGKMKLSGQGAQNLFGEWNSSWPTTVGVGGTGELEFFLNAILTDSASTLGYDPGSIGTANVGYGFDSMSCFWISSGSRTVGRNGTGTLTVENDGWASNDGDGEIAAFGGSIGNVYVLGKWYNNASLYVGGTSAGVGGTGTLDVDGGTVSVEDDMTIWPTGTVTIDSDDLNPFTVMGHLKTTAGSSLTLTDGKLSLGSSRLLDGTFTWTQGLVEFPTGDALIELNDGLGSSQTLTSGKTLSVAGALSVGPEFTGTLNVLGSTVTSGSGVIGSTEATSVAGIVILQSGARWNMPGDLTVRGHNNADLSVVAGSILSNNNAFAAAEPGTTAEIGLSDEDTEWNSSGSVYLGGDDLIAGGSGKLEVLAGAWMYVAGTLKVWDNFEVDVADSLLDVGSLEIAGDLEATGSSTVDVTGGSVNVNSGGMLITPITGNPETEVTLEDSGSSWTMTGSLEVATSTTGSGHIGSLNAGTGTSVTVEGNIVVLDNSAFALDGGTVTAEMIHLAENDFVGSGVLAGDVKADGNIIANGNLVMGNPGSYTGARIDGNLDVGMHTVTVNKAGFFNIGFLTSISGGTLIVPGGASIPTGHSLVGSGMVDGRVATQAGTVIEATGNLTLGDASSAAGFLSYGEMLVHQHTVTILDSNKAVLGSLTELGSESGDGTLVAANGLLVESSNNVIGHGTINTPDDPTKPLVNNGMLHGDSSEAGILLTGYVKGIGSFDNFTCTGTFSPGLSPIQLPVGNMTLTSSATLVMEIGGTVRGDDYDALTSEQSVILDGTLTVVLIDGFKPVMGNSFDLFDFTNSSGEFDDVLLEELDHGLQWYDSQLYTTGLLIVTTNGDIDQDGDVDDVDLNLLLSGFDSPPSTLDLANLNALLGNFGRTDMSDGNPVPEPHTALLLATGMVALFTRIRRRRK